MDKLIKLSEYIDFSIITPCGECCIGCKKKENGFCEGCIESKGNCKEWKESKGCPIFKCAKNHNVQFCGLCNEFPCKWLIEKVTWNQNIVGDLKKLSEIYYKQINEMKMYEYKINYKIDPKEIAELRKSVGWNGMLEEYKKSLLNSYFYICCFSGNELVGFLDVVSNGVTDAYIQDVMVKPSFQKKGIGKKLMEIAIDKLKKDEIYAISVLFSENNLSFYKKFGFHIMLSGQMETRKVK
jgi:ribosomal protein S18 acetylase RimI-like enzyme